jgi:hypothetical protein
MKVGVDFDNTIVNYDKVFHKVALEQSLIKSNLTVSKNAVRDYLKGKDQNDIWTELQGYVYGKRLLDAEVFPGFIDFLIFASKNKINVIIVSHKTIYPYLGTQYNLHDSAREFIAESLTNKNKNFVNKRNIFFESTLANKVLRINREFCDFFIDDLPEVFALNDFPNRTKKILFNPDKSHKNFIDGEICSSWRNIKEVISNDFFGR